MPRRRMSAAGLKVVATVRHTAGRGRQGRSGRLRCAPANPTRWCTSGSATACGASRDALLTAGWDPPRYTTTAFEMAHINAEWMHHLRGWIGLDSYDERNAVGQAFLDRFEARYGRRPGHSMPGLCHDVATVIVRGLAAARPLTGEGVKDGIEQVKLVPAASGAPGTFLRFGRFIRQGWLGTDYLIARRVLARRQRARVPRRAERQHRSRDVGQATDRHAAQALRLAGSRRTPARSTIPGGCASTSGMARTAPIAIIRCPGWACCAVVGLPSPADVELQFEARHALDDGADQRRLLARRQWLESPLRKVAGEHPLLVDREQRSARPVPDP